LGLFENPPVFGGVYPTHEETIYIQAISGGRAFSTSGQGPPDSLRPSLGYLDSVLSDLEGGLPFRAAGYLAEFRFDANPAWCKEPIDPVPWTLREVDLQRLRLSSNRIVLPPRYAPKLRAIARPFVTTALEGRACDVFWWRPLYLHE
jgi:hypothetical protein